MPQNQRNRLVIFGLMFAAVLACGVAKGADAKPVQRGGQEVDHPLGLVAFASVNRIRVRATTLAENLGNPDHGEKLLSGMLGGDDAISKLLNSPGLDTTKPIGAMSYPNWFVRGGVDDESESTASSDENSMDAPIEFIFQKLATMFVEDATLVVCIPAKDRDSLLESIRQMIAKEGELISVESQPGWYHFSKDEDTRIGFVGNYLMLVVDDGEVKHFDRNYPDFDKLARSSLGKNGFVYALYRRGLPSIVRDVMAPAFKMAFAARFQQQDDEKEVDFRLRTMFGTLQTELIDLALSHVEEFRITGHVDTATRTIMVEPEIIGPKDGKLAKYFSGLKIKGSSFANLSPDIATISMSASLPLPQKQWKPVSEALHSAARSIGKSGEAELIRHILAKTVDSGQLDFYAMTPDWNQGLFALRVSGNTEFPEQFQELLKLTDPPLFDLVVDSVEGISIHRSMKGLSIKASVMGGLSHVLHGQNPDLPDLHQKSVEVEYAVRSVAIDRDGIQHTAVEKKKRNMPLSQNILWVAATPQSIWFGLGSTEINTCPEWFKSQIAASLTTTAGQVKNTGKTPFQLTLRGLGASPSQPAPVEPESPKSDIKPAAATTVQQNAANKLAKEHQEARGDILRDMSNAIRCEVQSTETGVKLSLAFEEAYFHWFASLIKDSMEESQAARAAPPERIGMDQDVKQPKPDANPPKK